MIVEKNAVLYTICLFLRLRGSASLVHSIQSDRFVGSPHCVEKGGKL